MNTILVQGGLRPSLETRNSGGNSRNREEWKKDSWDMQEVGKKEVKREENSQTLYIFATPGLVIDNGY